MALSPHELIEEIERSCCSTQFSKIQQLIMSKGVTQQFLVEVFRKDKKTIRDQIANVRPIDHRGAHAVYDLKDAIDHCSDPVMDIDSAIRAMRPNDLPPYLQSEFWKAQRLRQDYEENAKDLWRTEKVVAVFSQVFKKIRETLILWDDIVEQQAGLTKDQKSVVCNLRDALINDLGKDITDFASDYEEMDKDPLFEDPEIRKDLFAEGKISYSDTITDNQSNNSGNHKVGKKRTNKAE